MRHVLLKALAVGQKTVNQLGKDAGVNWKTADNHLIHLIGRGFVKPVFISPYVKIYEITDAGRQALKGGAFR